MSHPRFSRRQFLSVASAAGGALAFPSCRRQKIATAAGDYFWSGIGFGIDMSMELYAVTPADGERLGARCEQIIREHEQAFSLYQENSELSILNRDRVLRRPSSLFRKLLNTAAELHGRTLGYYQPAVHGVWSWLEKRGSTADLDGDAEWLKLCAACDMKFIDIGRDGSIRLTHPLTQVSMNAIGQGFLADTVAANLRAAGVTSALLHLGETYAIGRHPEDRLWKLAVTGTAENGEPDIVGHLELADAGLAVSAQDSTRILIDPVNYAVRRQARVAAVVSGEGATVADAYATAFAVAPESKWNLLTQNFKQSISLKVRIWEENRLRFEKP